MINRITDGMLTGSTLNDINSTLGRLQHSSDEISSGKKILEPSDNPYGASRSLDLQSELDGLSSYAASAQDGISWTQTASGAVSSINESLQRVRELLISAGNSTNSQEDLSNMATEVGQLIQSIKQAANTQYAGQYIFAGTQTSTQPYAYGEADEYHGNTESLSRSVGPGATIPISTNLSSVLGNGAEAADGKTLDVLRTIVKNLTEGTAEGRAALTSTDLKALNANIEGLSEVQAETGSTTDRLQSATNQIEDLQSSVSSVLGNTLDANVAEATIAYSNEQASYEAALKASAAIIQESLLNFLK
jgi:flagellar hook-associated protein 3 FlgL